MSYIIIKSAQDRIERYKQGLSPWPKPSKFPIILLTSLIVIISIIGIIIIYANFKN
jgi:hypothetical protein